MISEAERIAGELTEAQRVALGTLPPPRDPDPVRRLAGRSYGSIWRKSSKHLDALLSLKDAGVVERCRVRGETLWRPTKPLGLEVKRILEGEE